MTNLAPRPYQSECLQSILEYHAQGINKQLVHLPTASGKTVIFSHLIERMKRPTLVLAHTIELLEQSRDKIKMICPELDVGIIGGGHKELDRSIIVSSIQSARQPEILDELQKKGFSLCIYDEAHRAGAETPREVLKTLGFIDSSEKLLVGFSATPFRNDGRGLGEVFEKVSYVKTIKEMISLGYLCPPKGIKIATDLDLSAVTQNDGDYAVTSLAKVMDCEALNNLIADTYQEHALNRKAICFGVTVMHAHHLAQAFRERGILSATVYGSMPETERKAILENFKAGSITVLCNCMILTEGFDCPDVSCVVIARPTQSSGLFQQMAGRGLRLYPNKSDCLILNFGDKNHSLCNVASLVGDAECVTPKCHQTNTTLVSFSQNLPATVNQKLKSAILSMDLLGDHFTWQKEGSAGYTLKGCGNKVLKMFATAEGKFSVILFDGNDQRSIARDLSFEYAFAAAEDFANNNRSHFTLSDLDAEWRKLPISDKQKDLFRSHGFKKGIEDLTRGQAALIISSGALNKKTDGKANKHSRYKRERHTNNV